MKMHLLRALLTLLAVASLGGAQTDATRMSKPQPGSRKSLEQTIIENSRATWEAYKSRNFAAIKAYTAEDYVSYSLEGEVVPI